MVSQATSEITRQYPRASWVEHDPTEILQAQKETIATASSEPGSEYELQVLAGRVFSHHLHRDRPLWEMWLVEGLDRGRFGRGAARGQGVGMEPRLTIEGGEPRWLTTRGSDFSQRLSPSICGTPARLGVNRGAPAVLVGCFRGCRPFARAGPWPARCVWGQAVFGALRGCRQQAAAPSPTGPRRSIAPDGGAIAERSEGKGDVLCQPPLGATVCREGAAEPDVGPGAHPREPPGDPTSRRWRAAQTARVRARPAARPAQTARAGRPQRRRAAERVNDERQKTPCGECEVCGGALAARQEAGGGSACQQLLRDAHLKAVSGVGGQQPGGHPRGGGVVDDGA